MTTPKDAQTSPESGEETPRSGIYMEFEPDQDPVVVRTARQVRRLGFALAIVCIIWISLPINIAVVQGILNGAIIDPESKRTVEADVRVDDCVTWGHDLMAGPDLATEEERQRWLTRCADRHPLIAGRLKR